MAQAITTLSRINRATRRFGRLFARPQLTALGCLAVVAVLGWIYVALMVAAAGPAQPDGGLPAPDTLAGWIGLPGWGHAYDVLCRSAFGTADLGAAALLAIVPMWIAMVAAMMLPTAGPMVLTYADMAETAAGEGRRAASPLSLIAGYGLVWTGFAVTAAVLQLVLTRAAVLDPAMSSASTLFSGAVFLAAGAYQFSTLKETCVTVCQQPAPFFSANWPDRPRDVFRLGVRQGAYCLGCCFAMMLVMFAVGVMNVIWMAALGSIMAAEKIAATTRFSRATGVVFAAIGIGFIAAAVAVHWPVRPAMRFLPWMP